jgi:hypothetical protein
MENKVMKKENSINEIENKIIMEEINKTNTNFWNRFQKKKNRWSPNKSYHERVEKIYFD